MEINDMDLESCEIGPIEALKNAGIDFVRLTHPEASTMELCRGIGAEYGAEHCKNLFLANKHGTRFFLLLMEADKPYKTSEVSRRLGSTRLSFGTPEQLLNVLGLTGGKVSVMGMVNKCALEAYREGKLSVAIDRDLFKKERICVHPNTGTASLVIRTSDIERFLGFLGVGFTAIEV